MTELKPVTNDVIRGTSSTGLMTVVAFCLLIPVMMSGTDEWKENELI